MFENKLFKVEGGWDDFLNVGCLTFYECTMLVDFGPAKRDQKFAMINVLTNDCSCIQFFYLEGDVEPAFEVKIKAVPDGEN